MLPLKLASSSESAALEENPDPQGSGAGQVDDSVTSNSSVLNAEASVEVADENSCSTRPPAAFEFSILRGSASVEGENEAEEEDGSEVRQQPVLVTWQLFPPAPAVPDVSRQPMAVSSSSSSRPPHWLDFTFCQADAPSEPGVAQQQPLLQKRRQPPQQAKKSRRGPQSRSSEYRGVTFYRRTGRWESHIWDCGKQLYLGGFDTAHAAARAYDRAAIKFRGFHADINFNLSDYEEDLEQTKNLSKEEFVHLLRRQSTGFSRGSSKYKSLTLPPCHRREAPMEQFHGKKAYDKAPIKYNGREAVTNSEPSTFEGDMFSGGDTEGHNLDLNLRISQPVVPKWNQNLLGGQFVDSDADKSKRERENRPDVGLLQAPSVWNWPTNSQSPFPLLSSAASSGFSTTKMMAAVSSLQSSAPSVTHHLHFSPQATPNHYFRN